MTKRYFHFNLGPVQGFVAQARRTRDFWAGSFLLSYMAGVAMQAVAHQQGTIVFPEPPPEFIKALKNGGHGPRQGGVPNRFTARVPDDFQPDAVVRSVWGVWQQLADRVWQRDGLDAVDPTGGARRVWDEQIATFWDITWVLTDGYEPAALDRRKNWRAYYPPDQGGAKCMIMDGWRELSGADMFPADKRREFWRHIRDSRASGIATDIAEGETLCAIAYVKRRFARHFAEFSANAGGWTAYGWPVPTAVPSVAYVAAAGWLAEVIEHTDPQKVWAFHNKVKEFAGDYGEWDSDLACIREALNKRQEAHHQWQALDGSLFFPFTYENENRFPGLTEERRQAKALLGKLRDETVPSPFYAVLAMDGDRLGALLEQGHESAVSAALLAFTRQVPDIVDWYSGFLIYAGGDDVLALLPLDNALACAAEIRGAYLQACENKGLDGASISAGVHFAHFHAPLGRILGDSHRLLDDVAKDQTERNALAVRVSKPSGVACTWSKPWTDTLSDQSGEVLIQRLAQDFAERNRETPFSSKFFYRIREQMKQLDAEDSPLAFDDKVALMASRYLASGINVGRKPKLTMADARLQIQPLMDLSRRQHEPHGSPRADDPIHADAALLIRFLAAKGLTREDAR